MKFSIGSLLSLSIGSLLVLGSCKPEAKEVPFCEADCLSEAITFTGTHANEPYVSISVKDCKADTIFWGNKKQKIESKLIYTDFTGKEIQLNKNNIRAHFNEDKNVWLLFNDCATGQGFYTNIPLDGSNKIVRKNNGIHNFDKKYVVDNSLLAYSDRGNIMVVDLATQKEQMMTFGKMTDLDFLNMHTVLDSVNISRTRIWAKVKIGEEWKELEKTISFE